MATVAPPPLIICATCEGCRVDPLTGHWSEP
jgi:hypothetical protein